MVFLFLLCRSSFVFYCPFVLKQIEDSTKSKGPKIKADIIGPNAQNGRFPAMSAVACAPCPVKRWHSHSWWALLMSLDIIAGLTRNLLQKGVQRPCHAHDGCVRWRASMAAVFMSFCLETNRRFDEVERTKSSRPHHRSQRTKRTLPRHVGQACPPSPD